MDPSRILTDRVLLRATITPGASGRSAMRVVIMHRREPDGTEEQRGFSDAKSAAAFVQTWLQGLEQRWEQGGRSHGRWEE